jgi:ATP-dependent DNA ligase
LLVYQRADHSPQPQVAGEAGSVGGLGRPCHTTLLELAEPIVVGDSLKKRNYKRWAGSIARASLSSTRGNKARSRRKPQSSEVQAGDDRRLHPELLEVHCGNCRPERHLYLYPEILRLPKRMPVPDEIKHDGYRTLIVIEGGKIRVFSRHGRDWTGPYRRVVEACAKLPCNAALIDGEIIVQDENGISDFEALRSAI